MPVYQIAYPYNYAMKSSVLFHVAGGYSISRGDIQASRKVPKKSKHLCFDAEFIPIYHVIFRYSHASCGMFRSAL